MEFPYIEVGALEDLDWQEAGGLCHQQSGLGPDRWVFNWTCQIGEPIRVKAPDPWPGFIWMYERRLETSGFMSLHDNCVLSLQDQSEWAHVVTRVNHCSLWKCWGTLSAFFFERRQKQQQQQKQVNNNNLVRIKLWKSLMNFNFRSLSGFQMLGIVACCITS